MNAEQQKGASRHGDGGTGGTRTPPHGSQQTLRAWEPQRALTTHLMEQICDPKNLIRAYRRVRANKGKPGVDGMTVRELADWLRSNHKALTASLLDGTYQPQPVRGVQIPKPGGGQRQLGIPVVVDRLVQQAILQVLEPILDPTFSNSSYGFRPGRSAQGSPLGSASRTGAAIREPGGAQVRRRFRSGEILRPGQSRYLDVPSRAQDRRQTPPWHHPALSTGRHDAGWGVRGPR
jgi:RNA-directed DNA polymerase